MTKPDKYQIIRIAIAVDHYDNYMRTGDEEYLELYANVTDGLIREGISFSAHDIMEEVYASRKNTNQ